jgi:Spx/MgsR family transcriptional regulator
MSNVSFYGIPNCDTVKKARKWLEAEGIGYDFHDYKKEGADPEKLHAWSEKAGWEVLLNKRGTTFRKLDEADRADIDQAKAVRLMSEHPSLIKRPVVEHDGGLLVGFKPDDWDAALK